MVQGTRERFRYARCSDCGVLFLVDAPADISKYYHNYYTTSARQFPPLTWRRRLMGRLRQYLLTHDNRLTRRVLKSDSPRLPLEFKALARLGLRADARILDVGSGAGSLVYLLDACGFSNVVGCDPFIDQDIAFANGARVRRAGLEDIDGMFDLIMLHHVFERVPNLATVAKQIASRLDANGTCVLRFPHVESVEFRKYRGDWWGLHAPRHYFLHSRRSLEHVFGEAGMRIVSAHCDSRNDHYLYSHEYALDIDDRSPLSFRNGHGGLWLDSELQYFTAKARRYNQLLVGDWIVYYLKTA